MRRFPYIILTIILIIFLGFPYILKLKNSVLEIYPAILFPAGSELANNNIKTLKVSSVEIYGIKKKGDTVKIDKRKFFTGIPLHYFQTIQNGHMGLKKVSRETKLYTPPIKFPIRNNFTASSNKQTKKWYRQRLKDQGVEDSIFFIRKYQLIFDVESKKINSKTLIHDEAFNVY